MDKCIFKPEDLEFKLIESQIKEKTKIIGTFNPALTRLKNGNLLLMIRVAEALEKIEKNSEVRALRFDKKFRVDNYKKNMLDFSDPRVFQVKTKFGNASILTSLSWLLPVELNESGDKIVKVHYDKIISPENEDQEYGIEDARITKIKIKGKDKWFMTAVCVSSKRIGTGLYVSNDGLNYKYKGLVLDEQNKDAVLFSNKIKGKYFMLTRPMGPMRLISPDLNPGFSIHLTESKDLEYWKPEKVLMKPDVFEKVGPGAPPFLHNGKWIVVFHGVNVRKDSIGSYKTFYAKLDKNNPLKVLKINKKPILKENKKLDKNVEKFTDNVVFTTGVEKFEKDYILASGQNDVITRITKIKGNVFN